MKRILLLLGCCAATQLWAQSVDFGVKGGVNYNQAVILDVVGTSGVDMQDLEMQNGSSLVFGGFVRFAGTRWILQPELLFSENQSSVTLADADVQNMDLSDFLTIKVDKTDVPVLFGYKVFSTVRLMAGPVFTCYRTTSDDPLFSMEDMTVGYQAGVSFDVSKLTFDARYESNLNKFKENIETENGLITVDTRKSLFQFTVGYKFFD